MRILKLSRVALLATATALAALGTGSLAGLDIVSPAEARVGRPATPVSVAGVARRTTRRAVVGTAVVAGTAGCVQTVDAYGRVVTVC